jgi:hypothetical protein
MLPETEIGPIEHSKHFGKRRENKRCYLLPGVWRYVIGDDPFHQIAELLRRCEICQIQSSPIVMRKEKCGAHN